MKNLEITEIDGLKILDSRGEPTIEVRIQVEENGDFYPGRAAAPSGASVGKNEVVAFPDGGVDIALEGLEKIAEEIKGSSFDSQTSFDERIKEIDGTENLRRIGGNTTVALSMAFAKAASSASGVPLYYHCSINSSEVLPYPLGNVLGGGAHAGVAAPDIQEFLALPLGAESFEEAAFGNARVHRRVKELVSEKDEHFTGGKSDEGAWAPDIDDEDALETVAKACEEVSDEVGFEIRPGLDVAASSLYDSKSGKYEYRRGNELLDSGEQIDLITNYVEKYDLVYVEDPIQEEDFDSFAEITRRLGKRCLICGDDIYVTNVNRIKKGVEEKATNTVLIKPNQIGTLTDTKKAVEVTKENNEIPVISHRSGETTDDTIAHLAIGFGCPVIKTGVVGGERIAKLNELIRIEKELGKKAKMGELNGIRR